MSQNKTILSHLKKKGKITTWEAITKYRITRLAARISDLKDLGHDITKVMIESKGKRFAKYSLK